MDATLEKVIAAVRRAQETSPYYRELLAGLTIDDWPSFSHIPFTDEQTLRREGARMVCVPPQNVARIVSFLSSGTEGPAKRIFFSRDDLVMMRRYLCSGFQTFCTPGQTVLVTFSCRTPDSLGALVCAACEDAGLRTVSCDQAESLQDAVELCVRNDVVAFAGPPRHALALAHWTRAKGTRLAFAWTLLSGDCVSVAARREIAEAFSCEPFDHYGTTEMGFGCALECHAHQGLHIRENDLYLEVVDPQTGANVPRGQWGEIVFTSLSAEAMPLLRYRTGDWGCMLEGDCACGRAQRRLDMAIQRCAQPSKRAVDMIALDDALSAIPALLDYEVHIDAAGGEVQVHAVLAGSDQLSHEALEELEGRLSAVVGGEMPQVTVSVADGGASGVCCGGKPFPLQKRVSYS